MRLSIEEENSIKNRNKNYKLHISVQLMKTKQKEHEKNHYVTKNYINYFFGDAKEKDIYGAYFIKNNGVYEDIHHCNKDNNFVRHNSLSDFKGLKGKNLQNYLSSSFHSVYLDFKDVTKTDEGINFIPFWNKELETNDSGLEKSFNDLMKKLQDMNEECIKYNFTEENKKIVIEIIQMNAKRSPYIRFNLYYQEILNMLKINKRILYDDEFLMFTNYCNQNLVNTIENNNYLKDLQDFELNIIYNEQGRFVLTDTMMFEMVDENFDAITKISDNLKFCDLNHHMETEMILRFLKKHNMPPTKLEDIMYIKKNIDMSIQLLFSQTGQYKKSVETIYNVLSTVLNKTNLLQKDFMNFFGGDRLNKANVSQEDLLKFFEYNQKPKKIDRILIPISSKIIIDLSRKTSDQEQGNALKNKFEVDDFEVDDFIKSLNIYMVNNSLEFYTDNISVYNECHEYMNKNLIEISNILNFYRIPIFINRNGIDRETATLSFCNKNLTINLNERNFLSYKKEDNYKIKNLIFNIIEKGNKETSTYIWKDFINNEKI